MVFTSLFSLGILMAAPADEARRPAGVVAECARLFADLDARRIDDTRAITDGRNPGLLYTVWDPEHSINKNVHFLFPDSGEHVIVTTGYESEGPTRFVGGWVSMTLAVGADGTVARQDIGADGRPATELHPTTHWSIDPARARGIIAYATNYAHVDDSKLLRTLEFIADEIAAGALDDFRPGHVITPRAYRIELGLDQ